MIPDYQTIMLPLLKLTTDKEEHHIRKAVETLAVEFELPEEERKELLPSEKQEVFDNRVGWAKTYLTKAGLLRKTGVGRFRITDEGLKVLEEPPERIDMRFLMQFEEFAKFRRPREKKEEEEEMGLEGLEGKTPTDILSIGHKKLQKELAAELLGAIGKSSPEFFERLVVDLLVAMGYGGSRKDAGRAIGGTRDGGVDGVIDEDKLGLDRIYIQAKRWSDPVGRSIVQQFVGALQGKGAKKGVLITTSHFSPEALEYNPRSDITIVLIDGRKLTDFMMEYDVGVVKTDSFDAKELDEEYFPEE